MSEAPQFSVRQERLLAAAVRVVAAGGLRGLTHRAVDAQADLPQGTCSAYMRTRLALLTRLTEYVAAQFSEDIAALTGRIEEHVGVEGYAVSQTVAMLRSWLDAPDLLLVRMELSIEGARQPAVAEIFAHQSRQLVAVVEHAMDAAGHEHGRTRAVTLIAAIDGVLLRALREDASSRTDLMSASLEVLMGTLVSGPGEPTV